MCLEPINIPCLKEVSKNNITITISSVEELKNILNENIKDIKAHIKLDTGMNRLGIKENEDLKEMLLINDNKKIKLEGIYTHMANADMEDSTYFNYQINKFKEITKNIDLNQFEIIHVGNSATLLNHRKLDFCNGIRLGIAMYGLNPTNKKISLKPVFSLHSTIVQIKKLKQGEFVGYNLNYVAEKEELIAIIPIGYADGIIRKNTNRFVIVNKQKYKIIGNICMDMLMIKADENIHINDEVTLIGEEVDANYVANHLETINYEVICSISDRVHKVYIKNNKKISEKSIRFK